MLNTINMIRKIHWDRMSIFKLQHLKAITFDFIQNCCLSVIDTPRSLIWSGIVPDFLQALVLPSLILSSFLSTISSRPSWFARICFIFWILNCFSAPRRLWSKYANSTIAHPTKNKHAGRLQVQKADWKKETLPAN